MKKCDQCDQFDPIPNTRPRPSSDSPVTEATSCLQNKVSKWIIKKLTKVKFPEVGWKYHGRGQILETRSIGRKIPVDFGVRVFWHKASSHEVHLCMIRHPLTVTAKETEQEFYGLEDLAIFTL